MALEIILTREVLVAPGAVVTFADGLAGLRELAPPLLLFLLGSLKICISGNLNWGGNLLGDLLLLGNVLDIEHIIKRMGSLLCCDRRLYGCMLRWLSLGGRLASRRPPHFVDVLLVEYILNIE